MTSAASEPPCPGLAPRPAATFCDDDNVPSKVVCCNSNFPWTRCFPAMRRFRAPDASGARPETSAIMGFMDDRAQALGESIWSALQRMVREILSRKAGGHLIDARLPDLDLRLPLAVQRPDADPRAFASQLRALIDRQLDEAIQEAAAFRPGHVFCHRCGAAACDHSLPPSSRHVFVWYAPTGTPRWAEFAQYCLDQRHPDVDRLFE